MPTIIELKFQYMEDVLKSLNKAKNGVILTKAELELLKSSETTAIYNYINTKQNLSILNENFPNFRDLLFKNKQLRNKVLFLH